MYFRKAEIEMVFDDKPSSRNDDDSLNFRPAAEAQVLVRALLN